jgi:ABC-type nitrate/sulfonate/bicarbonate transport system permease component
MIEFIFGAIIGFAIGWIIAIILGYHYGRKDMANELVGLRHTLWP